MEPTLLITTEAEEVFASKFELQARLYTLICDQCRYEEGITEISNIDDMLCTACGAQYYVE